MKFGKTSTAEISQLIEEKMQACPVGDIVTFAQMAEIRGFNKSTNCNPLRDAINRLHGAGIFFLNERTVGYRRLTKEEATVINLKRKNKIAKSARRGVKDCKTMLDTVGNSDISNDVKIQICRDQTNFGLAAHLMAGKFKPNVVSKDNEIKPMPLRQSAAALYEQVCGKR